jgi:hypothetical protein
MLLYIDTTTSATFQSGPAVGRTLSGISLIRGDLLQIDLSFCSNNSVYELDPASSGLTASGSLAIKQSGQYAGTLLAQGSTVATVSSSTPTYGFVKSGSGSSSVYTFGVNLNTTALAALFAAVSGVEPVSVSAMLEVSWTINGLVTSTNALPVTIYNDVNRTGASPVTPTNPTVAWSALTGVPSFVTSSALSAYATVASLASYATTAALSAYATTASLSSYVTTTALSAYATTASLASDVTTSSLGSSIATAFGVSGTGSPIYGLTVGTSPTPSQINGSLSVTTALGTLQNWINNLVSNYVGNVNGIQPVSNSVTLKAGDITGLTINGTTGTQVSSVTGSGSSTFTLNPSNLSTLTSVTPATGTTGSSSNSGKDEFVYFAHGSTIATYTHQLPSDATSTLGQIVTIGSKSAVTAFTLSLGGQTLLGTSPTALAANQVVAFQKVATSTWFRTL